MLRALGSRRALEVLGVKTARHALDRLKERTDLDPSVIGALDAIAEKLTGRGIAPGNYYLPLPRAQGYAAFKTVGKDDKLVLATILAKHMHPKGTPILNEAVKEAGDDDDGPHTLHRAAARGIGAALGTLGVNAALGVAAGLSPAERVSFRGMVRSFGLKPAPESRRGPAAAFAYDPTNPKNRGTVFVPSGGLPEAVLGHELGHAVNRQWRGRLGLAGRALDALHLRSKTLAARSALPAAFWAGAQEEPTWTPGLIQAGIAAPMLVEEGTAWAHALRHMVRRHGLGNGIGKTLAAGAPAYGTYLTLGLAPLAVTGLRKYLRSREKDAAEVDPELEARFGKITNVLSRRGVFAGTAHRRVTVPKTQLTEADVKTLGFEPVLLAIPEAGQDRFTSYRHPDNTFHIHSHGDRWTIHKDRHAAATMLARRYGQLKSMIIGAPHLFSEGVPGLYYYLKGQVLGRGSTADEVERRLKPEVRDYLTSLGPSPSLKLAAYNPRQHYIPMMGLPRAPPTPSVTSQADFRARMNAILKRNIPVGTQLQLVLPDPLPGVKAAAVTTALEPHQERVVRRMQNPHQRGLVVAHPVGSGKTLSAIATADALGMPADVVVPAALRANFEKELEKHTDTPPPVALRSLQEVARKGGEDLRNPLLIVDEAHRARNPTKTQAALRNSWAAKRLLLTGSLLYNDPADIAGPINLVAGEPTLPSNQADFHRAFVRERTEYPSLADRFLRRNGRRVSDINPATKGYLEDVLHKYVDYHEGSREHFPTTSEEVLRVPMSTRQREVYKTIMGQAPAWVRARIRAGMPPSKQEAAQLNAFLTGARQVSNTTAPFHSKGEPVSPKIEKAVAELQDVLEQNPRAKAVVYSNYLQAGVNPYKQKLEELGIPFGEFTGEMPKRQRDRIVRDYNDDKLKALLLSSAGGEGLDLQGTRLIQVLEPHWNNEKIKQVVGRGVRYQSHEHLAPEERNVLVQRFLAVHPKDTGLMRFFRPDPGRSVDEYLHQMAASKDRLNDQFRQLLAGEQKTAADEERSGGKALGLALTAGALGAGGLLLRDRRPFFSPRAAANAKALLALRAETNPTKYVDGYARLGSRLIRNRVFGKTTGQEAVTTIRDSAPMHWLARHGIGNKYDAGSVEHYRQFAKGPRAARRVMVKEIGGDSSDTALYREFKGYIDNYRPALYTLRGASAAEQTLRAYALPVGAAGLVGAGALAVGEKKEAAEGDETHKPRSSVLPNLLTAGLAGGAGLASYKFFRAPRLSTVPSLRKFQERTLAKGLHRPFDVTHRQDVGPGFGYGLLDRLMPHADRRGNLNAWNRFKLWAQGGESAVPYVRTSKGDARMVKTPGRVEGGVYGREGLLQGGVDAEGPPSTMKAVTELSAAGKAREADLLQRHAPGVIADTETNLSQFFRARRQAAPETLNALKQRLEQRFGGRNFVVKPTVGAQSQGAFPARDLDWALTHRRYQDFLRTPEHARFVNRHLGSGNEGALAQYLRKHKMYEGHVLDRMLADPSSALAQEWLPGALGEYRVHALQGGAPTSMMANRTLKSFATNAWNGVDKEQIRRFVENDVLAKLPEKYRRGAYGMDVMPFRNPDGSISFKVIELNPTESSAFTSSGVSSDSGFLDSSMQPFGHWRAHRGLTGQMSQPEAAARALGTAGLAGLGAGLALSPTE